MKKYLFSFLFLLAVSAQAQLNLKYSTSGDDPTRAEIIQSAKNCQLILVLDQSGSMEDFNKIGELNDAVATLFQGIQSDQALADKLEVGVVAFESDAQVMRRPSLIQGQSAPRLSADGGTDMGEGLEEALQLLNNTGTNDLQPIVILITDGEPDSQSDALRAAQRVHPNAHFYALGVQGSDFSFLQQMAGPNQAAALAQTKFSSFFADMSTQISQYIMSSSPMSAKMGIRDPFTNGIRIPNFSG
ncbi:MAG: VWA domain-containing protein, partial [Bacteroidota bacterium]